MNSADLIRKIDEHGVEEVIAESLTGKHYQAGRVAPIRDGDGQHGSFDTDGEAIGIFRNKRHAKVASSFKEQRKTGRKMWPTNVTPEEGEYDAQVFKKEWNQQQPDDTI